MSYALGTTIRLSAEFASTPASPVQAHVKAPDGGVDSVTLTLDEGSGLYVGNYTAADIGWHTWTVDTGAPASVRNGARFEVVGRSATPA
jgi:hypothetical protein